MINLPSLSGERTVVYDEMHGNRRLGDLLERNRFHMIRRAECVTDVQISDTGDRYDGADRCFVYFYFIQTVKLIQFADLYFFLFVRIVMVDKNAVLVDTDGFRYLLYRHRYVQRIHCSRWY